MRSPASVLAPAVFIAIWSTGFVVARFVAPYADPLTFLALRFGTAAVVLAGIALASGAPWPTGRRGWLDAAVAGLLLHGLYLGAVFWAVAQGLPAGVSAVISGAQPLATALFAGPLLHERVSRLQWIGIVAGFAGIVLVLAPKLGGGGAYSPAALVASLVGLASITFGTIWQKRRGTRLDLRTGTAIQFAAAASLVFIGALATERLRIDLSGPLLAGFGWSVLVNSVGGVALLLLLLRRGDVVAVSALFFLVPPLSALISHLMFGETLTGIQLAGMAVAAAGVALASGAWPVPPARPV